VKRVGPEKVVELWWVRSARLFEVEEFVRLMKGETNWFRAALKGRPVKVTIIAMMQIRQDKIPFMCLE
jgi:hypothetical protein